MAGMGNYILEVLTADSIYILEIEHYQDMYGYITMTS